MDTPRQWSAAKTLVTMLSVALFGISAAHASDPVTKCQSAKLKARGKLQLCLAKNSARVLAGKADASADCQDKFADALARAGTACRFLDNGDATVSDLDTGLTWEKKDYGCPGLHCVNDQFSWCAGGVSCSNPANPPDGSVFTIFLDGLNGGTSPDGVATTGCFAGHCDWRLPTIEELKTILLEPDPCGTAPCIDPTFGPTQTLSYWTITGGAAFPDRVWRIAFTTGFVGYATKPANTLCARAVRSGP